VPRFLTTHHVDIISWY